MAWIRIMKFQEAEDRDLFFIIITPASEGAGATRSHDGLRCIVSHNPHRRAARTAKEDFVALVLRGQCLSCSNGTFALHAVAAIHGILACGLLPTTRSGIFQPRGGDPPIL